MIAYPNAKINLGLRITGRLPNGYHSLETLFLPIGLKDALEIVPRSQTTPQTEHRSGSALQLAPADAVFTPVGQDLICIEGFADPCPPEQNLVYKALCEARRVACVPAVQIYLRKQIPSGAGLGGGSSDATFTLLLLNRLFNLNLSPQTLASTAARLGADCPFFLLNRPVLAKGIGNEFTPVSLPECLRSSTIAVVKPPVSISTAQAYRLVDELPPRRFPSVAEASALTPPEWPDALGNDFELALLPLYPELKEIKDTLYRAGAFYAAMSGSGSAFFGLWHGSVPTSLHTLFPLEYTLWTGPLLQ